MTKGMKPRPTEGSPKARSGANIRTSSQGGLTHDDELKDEEEELELRPGLVLKR